MGWLRGKQWEICCSSTYIRRNRLRGTQKLTKKIAFHFNKIMRLTIIMPKAVKKIKAPSKNPKRCVCLVL